ncbi:hypothetical protein [Nonomuraea jabiensis]|uniref:hypothetical protein n=1 Tax=Nonomuraea jabiensis TaxID=882448 RepID=UPI003679160B
MTPTPIPPCWSRAEIQVVAQVDAGGLEFGDPTADAVFDAVHQTVPLARRTKAGTQEPVSEQEVLEDLCQPLVSNEPHIRFITGRAGTGKSHLVRWLRVKAELTPPSLRENWHFVYIEKRNTSLRRIIERVLDGIDTPSAGSLRANLARAAAQVTTVQEAMLALLNHLHRLVEFDDTPVINNLSGQDLATIRQRTARLVGDYTVKQLWSRPGGPIERIARLAKNGHQADADINSDDLHLNEADLTIGPEAFIDASATFQRSIREFVSNRGLRTAIASVLDYYLPRATAEVFTGSSTDLLHVFEDVRSELARRNQELFLFVEDLVLLHGIDAQLAQALTLPARTDLCPIRAVIAVTSGYLDDRYATFAERGVHYTMDVERKQVDTKDLRSFVGKYLNAGRVGRRALSSAAQSGEATPNKCIDCSHKDRCHPAFGVTADGHGLFPFNAAAVDNLIRLASPNGFDPRNILREVVRAPLEVAEAELSSPGVFPSARFAAGLAPTRLTVPVELRDAINRQSNTSDAEISLRAFYAANPPVVDEQVQRVADILGVRLTELAEDDARGHTVIEPAPNVPESISEIDLWVSGRRLGTQASQKIRRWILDALAARLQNGPHGLAVKRASSNIIVGPLVVKPSSIFLPNAAGGGSHAPEGPAIRFSAVDRDGVVLKGILSATAGDLTGPNGGRWFFEMQDRLDKFESEIVAQARHEATATEVSQALAVLGVLSTVDSRNVSTPADALAIMIRPRRPDNINPSVVKFLDEVERHRTSALTVVRNNLTQRKGGGAPSIFDAGAILDKLLPCVQLTELPADIRDEANSDADRRGIKARAFHDRQANAVDILWTPVRSTLEEIGNYVTEGEDLLTTLTMMDNFVAQAHRASALARSDAKDHYDRLRKRVSGEQISTLSRFRRLVRSGPSASSLWDLLSDPLPVLTDVLAYWRLCDELLRSLRDTTPSTSGLSETYDRARLQRALRGLADTLEGLNR